MAVLAAGSVRDAAAVGRKRIPLSGGSILCAGRANRITKCHCPLRHPLLATPPALRPRTVGCVGGGRLQASRALASLLRLSFPRVGALLGKVTASESSGALEAFVGQETDTEHFAGLSAPGPRRTCLSLQGLVIPGPASLHPSLYSLSPARYAEAQSGQGGLEGATVAASECVLGMWQSPRAEFFLCLARDAVEAGGNREMPPQKLRGLSVHRSHLPQAGVHKGLSNCEHQHAQKELLACNPRGRPKGPPS